MLLEASATCSYPSLPPPQPHGRLHRLVPHLPSHQARCGQLGFSLTSMSPQGSVPVAERQSVILGNGEMSHGRSVVHCHGQPRGDQRLPTGCVSHLPGSVWVSRRGCSLQEPRLSPLAPLFSTPGHSPSHTAAGIAHAPSCLRDGEDRGGLSRLQRTQALRRGSCVPPAVQQRSRPTGWPAPCPASHRAGGMDAW